MTARSWVELCNYIPTALRREYVYRADGDSSCTLKSFLIILTFSLRSSIFLGPSLLTQVLPCCLLPASFLISANFNAPKLATLSHASSLVNTLIEMSSDTDSQPHFKFYHYDPSFAGALVFTILFGVANVWHLALIAKHRTWYFIPVVVGGIFKNSVYYDLSTSADVECEVEIVGYAARAWSNKQAPNPTIGPYVVQTLLILVAPALFAASIYMVLGRIVISVDGESYSLIKKKWLTKVFVTSDVISFFIQLGGTSHIISWAANVHSNLTQVAV